MLNSKYIYGHNWNIGFCETTPEKLITQQSLSKIEWLKHPFKDRFFADPFVISADETTIYVLAEELLFSEKKGRIVRLAVDKKRKYLIEREITLELDSHLSYPAFYRENGKIYIFPENSALGTLKGYEYDESNNNISTVGIMINEPLADATLLKYNGLYWIFAAKLPKPNDELYLYYSDKILGNYTAFSDGKPVIVDNSCSRPAGNIFEVEKNLYRSAQNCKQHYGSGIVIQKILKLDKREYAEQQILSIQPYSFRYNLGIHTINFYNGGCIIDGYGYLYPLIGHISNYLIKKKNILFKKTTTT